jgi:uncharacterized protein (DUF952 family)
MPAILHIASRDAWEAARTAAHYRGDTLATDGFIHCSTPEQVVRVADAYFRGRSGLVLLAIDPSRLTAELRWEESPDGGVFPHIYGPLNLDAVVCVAEFEPGADGTFALPPGVVDAG